VGSRSTPESKQNRTVKTKKKARNAAKPPKKNTLSGAGEAKKKKSKYACDPGPSIGKSMATVGDGPKGKLETIQQSATNGQNNRTGHESRSNYSQARGGIVQGVIEKKKKGPPSKNRSGATKVQRGGRNNASKGKKRSKHQKKSTRNGPTKTLQWEKRKMKKIRSSKPKKPLKIDREDESEVCSHRNNVDLKRSIRDELGRIFVP